MSLYVTTTKL